ncbi:MAG: hypothetical protein LBQ05_01580 [Christensenellaceae bacterium]|nr:hypothetical protein [Christensenellaceae bacterium]
MKKEILAGVLGALLTVSPVMGQNNGQNGNRPQVYNDHTEKISGETDMYKIHSLYYTEKYCQNIMKSITGVQSLQGIYNVCEKMLATIQDLSLSREATNIELYKYADELTNELIKILPDEIHAKEKMDFLMASFKTFSNTGFRYFTWDKIKGGVFESAGEKYSTTKMVEAFEKLSPYLPEETRENILHPYNGEYYAASSPYGMVSQKLADQIEQTLDKAGAKNPDRIKNSFFNLPENLYTAYEKAIKASNIKDNGSDVEMQR